MKYPNLSEEKRLWKKGYKNVACLDEAGRGALCGPVIAAAVLIQDTGYKIQDTKIRDSKKLPQKQREELYKLITKSPAIKWGIGRVSEKVIDRINILEATKLAMKRAITSLEKKLQKLSGRLKSARLDFLILDGNFNLDLPIPQKSIIKADEKVFSCVAASIIAKVTRDRIMRRYHKKYPQYGFEKNKGYATKLHRKMLKKYGSCEIHRRSFEPCRTEMIISG